MLLSEKIDILMFNNIDFVIDFNVLIGNFIIVFCDKI